MDDSKKSIKSLKAKAWKLCSEYTRKKEERCFTCNTLVKFEESDAGHFIHGHNKLTFFEPDNLHKQCKRCNLYLSGNGIIYSLRMIDQYGRNRVDELLKLSKNGKVHTRKDILYWIKYYEDAIDKLNKQ